MYAVRDLGEFSDAVTMGAYVEYGKRAGISPSGKFFFARKAGIIIPGHEPDGRTEVTKGDHPLAV